MRISSAIVKPVAKITPITQGFTPFRIACTARCFTRRAKRAEINKITGKIAEKGYTLVPLKVYLKGSLVKVEIGLARGKKLYDKRQDIAKKDQEREARRDFKIRNLD